ncbi:MAG TPA: hypothetical protein EYQ14_20170 [Gammaproteobacteria bacterium]|nr:hypothetical protein [Gammaproteobacteria bacterium]HIL99163.1 hypothetical protein [Pseudomonadales bacterium]
MDAIENKMKALDKAIRNRTLYGNLTFAIAIVAMLAFDYLLILLDKPMLAVIGVLTWVVCLAIAMVRLFVLQRQNGGSDKALAMDASLQQQLLKVKSESRFYRSVATSILAPLGIGVVLILISTGPTLFVGTFQLGFFMVIAYWAHRFNLRHITENLKPLEDELEHDLQRLA